MLKAFQIGIIIAVVLALFAFILARPSHFDIVLPLNSDIEPFIADEGPVRSERSANISHIIGLSRKIQLIVNKIMFLQISPDGTVNGTDNDNDYTILQRASVNNYQIKIQGVVTCNFLCMDRCGLLYGSKEFTDDCIFNEMMESHHFNTYSSAKYSNDKRTLYLALNKKGIPRKVQTKAKAFLGKMETYTNVLTKPVSSERVEALAIKVAKARALLGKLLTSSSEDNYHLLRHHRYQFCQNVPMTKLDDKNKFRCRKREKRKKKRKCKEDEDDDDDCQPAKKKVMGKCEEDEDEEDCQKRIHSVRQKRKSRNGESNFSKTTSVKNTDAKEKKKKKRLKSEKKKFSENILKMKCNSERNCYKKKINGKGLQSEKKKTSPFASEDFSTASLLWKDSLIDHKSPKVVEPMTEKPTDDYDEDEQLEKLLEDEDDYSSAEAVHDWTTQISSSSSKRD